MSKLTLIIAVRSADFSDYRTRISLRDNLDLSDVHTVVIDDGSPAGAASEISEFCVARGYEYIRLETGLEPFSLSRSRNAGIRAARTEWICFEDADLVYPSNHYQRLIEELEQLDDTPFNFLTIPVAYLAEAPSVQIVEAGSVDPFMAKLTSSILIESPSPTPTNVTIESYAPATSVIALRKSLAMLVGGFDEAFSGWGGEDRDFAFRLLHANSKLQKPALFSTTKSWNLNDTVVFEGWRSLYRMVGDYLAMKGMYSFHIYHPHLPWRTGAKTNIEFASEKAKRLVVLPPFSPMHDPSQPSDVVIGNNPHILNEQVLSTLVNPRVVSEKIEQAPEAFADTLLATNVRNVIFWNPYGSPWRKQLYDVLNERGITTIVGERGALPRALYFDKGGLSVESPTYAETNWPSWLDDGQTEEVKSYLESIRLGSASLEKQNDRIGAGLLRMKLGIPSDRKILFVALQLSDDTVTTYFSEPDRSYEMFLIEVRRLSLMLPPDWVMIIKNHPLALRKADITSAVTADDYHIYDLIEASNAICLFNSGVGLEALAFYKPVFAYGRAFYRIDGLNDRFESAAQVRDSLIDLPVIDPKKVHRFFHHLINTVYSFADWSGRLEKKSATSQVFKLESLFFTTLRIDSYPPQTFIKREFNLRRSVIFDRFRHHAVAAAKPSPTVVSKAAPKEPLVTDVLTTKPAQAAPAKEIVVDSDKIHMDGLSKYHAGNFVEAAELLEAAARMKSNHISPYRSAAEAYFKAGNKKKAIEMLDRASSLKPGSKTISKRKRQMLATGWKKMLMRQEPYVVPLTPPKKDERA